MQQPSSRKGTGIGSVCSGRSCLACTPLRLATLAFVERQAKQHSPGTEGLGEVRKGLVMKGTEKSHRDNETTCKGCEPASYPGFYGGKLVNPNGGWTIHRGHNPVGVDAFGIDRPGLLVPGNPGLVAESFGIPGITHQVVGNAQSFGEAGEEPSLSMPHLFPLHPKSETSLSP